MAYPLFELVPIVRVREENQKASAAHGPDPEEETARKWPAVRLCVQNHYEKTSTVVLVCNNGKLKLCILAQKRFKQETGSVTQKGIRNLIVGLHVNNVWYIL